MNYKDRKYLNVVVSSAMTYILCGCHYKTYKSIWNFVPLSECSCQKGLVTSGIIVASNIAQIC